MSALTRKFKKIFGKDSANNGVFGSAAALSPAVSTDPEVIESLAAWLEGWSDATEGGLRLPTLEDTQGLKYDTDYHLAYMYQEGIPEYNASTTYYITPSISIVKETGTTKIYKSLTDANVGNPLTDNTKWQLLGDLTNLPSAALGTAAYVNTGTSSGDVPLIGTQSATTSLAGLVQLATNAEVAAGSSSQKGVVPSALLALFKGSLLVASSGYARLPIQNSGAFSEIIIQWAKGINTTIGDSTQTVNFPLTFPTAVLACSVSTINTSASTTGDAWFQEDSKTTSSIVVRAQWTGNGSVAGGVTPQIIAIGY